RAIAVDAAVPPRTEDHVDQVVVPVLSLERRVGMHATVHVLLVPDARHEQRRDLERLAREDLIERLATPELVVGRMLAQLLEERQLVDAEGTCESAGGPEAEEQLIVVVDAAQDLQPLAAAGGLAVDVIEVALAEGAVVKPIVTLPAIHHRALGDGGFQ